MSYHRIARAVREKQQTSVPQPAVKKPSAKPKSKSKVKSKSGIFTKKEK